LAGENSLFGRKSVAKYDVRLARSADNYRQKQTVKIQKQFDKKLNKLSEDPQLGYPLSGEMKNLWAIHSGKFRIEYKINEIECAIEIVRIGPRGDVYKK
jgi:mRNA interferase RelE/StbE